MSEQPFYDHPAVQAQYFAHRDRPDNPNDTLERPIFLQLVGDLRELDILDLGCGDAAFGREALAQGARSYEGIDVAQAMIELARQTLTGTPGKVRRKSIEAWQAAQPEQVDLAVSRLALHYIEQIEPVFQQIHQVLRPGGRPVFSVEHPVITSNFANLAQGRRTSWIVDDYFKPGARIHQWLGQEVTKYHRTLEDYLDRITHTGFELERLRESRPQRENFSSESEYNRRLRIPLFLLIAARKVL